MVIIGKRLVISTIISLSLIMFVVSFVSAWELNGTVYDTNSIALNNTNITVEMMYTQEGPPTILPSNSTTSDENGYFNLTVYDNDTGGMMYKIILKHVNSTTNKVDYIGQSLPYFSYQAVSNNISTNFYLLEAGIMNITAVNSAGSRIAFNYQVKDTVLGYTIESQWGDPVNESIVYVPRNRNYSVIIYPDQSMPVSFDWNNFSSNSSYDFANGLSSYNKTTHTVQKTFNTSMSLIHVSGYINSTGVSGWDNFTIVPYVLEPGNMIFVSDAGYGTMPYNMSSWNHNSCGFTIVPNETGAYVNSTGYNLGVSGKFNYNITAVWANVSGTPYLISPSNYTLSINGLTNNTIVPNATEYNDANVSYTYYEACGDEYNLTSGFYNITLPGPAEGQTILLFASAKNGSNYYGSYKNISVSYSSSNDQYNLTMYGMLGNTSANITMYHASNFSSTKKVVTKKQTFNLVNSSSGSVSMNSEAHIEVQVDYSSIGVIPFTFMVDASSGSSDFSVPLLNVTGVKEMNIYSSEYAPKRVGKKTASQILVNSNITLSSFSPGSIDENSTIAASVQVALYKSNSTCNVPNPPASCIIADSASMNESEQNAFNPLSSIIGGGKLNFRMGLLSSGIIVEYINVDMLASGPPDAMFDSAKNESTSGDFESAMRFGSNGPTIYDYVLISMPYTKGSPSQTGLDDSGQVNVSIPLLYGDSWDTPIWNVSANGTSGTALEGNYSHYSSHPSEWQTLMGNNTCVTNQSNFNATNPCFINTTNHMIWLRIPHFSGVKPSILGSVITATTPTSTPTTTPSDGFSSTSSSFWIATHAINDEQFKKGYTKELVAKSRLRVSVENEYHYVGVVGLTETKATINVSSTPMQVILTIGQDAKFDINDDDVYDIYVMLNSIENNMANITIQKISEAIPKGGEAPIKTEGEITSTGGEEKPIEEKQNLTWLYLVIGIILVIIAVGIVLKKRKGKGHLFI